MHLKIVMDIIKEGFRIGRARINNDIWISKGCMLTEFRTWYRVSSRIVD